MPREGILLNEEFRLFNENGMIPLLIPDIKLRLCIGEVLVGILKLDLEYLRAIADFPQFFSAFIWSR